ncbi:MAG: class I SAM-dependent methyltransferase [Thermodesulfobacteriota bacterium]
MEISTFLMKHVSQNDFCKVHALDAPVAYHLHRKIIEQKPLLKETYLFYFKELLRDIEPRAGKKILEIGAGAYNTDEAEPGIITSNLALNDYIKVVVDARKIPFSDGSLDGIVMINTMHHIPTARPFFSEVSRTLKKGGVLAMVEPYFSPMGKVVWKYLHHEPVLDTPPDWTIPHGLTANQTMPYHIFIRDRKVFEKDFPKLKIQRISPHTCLPHLLSGGISYRCLVPDSMKGLVWSFEKLFAPLKNIHSLFMTVVVEKT